MTAHSFSTEDLQQQIQQDTAACTLLLDLLSQEREALKKRDTDALEIILKHKTEKLMQLDNSAKKRTLWAQQLNIDIKSSGWSQLLQELKKPDIVQSWGALKELIDDCKKSNEVNGKLLSRNQKTLSRLLDVVRGKNTNNTLYNAYGSSSSGAASMKVGEA